MIALLIGYESVERLIYPVPIAFNQAIPIAAVGLGVNLLSAFLLTRRLVARARAEVLVRPEITYVY